MARMTLQGRIRTTNGRPRSAMDKTTGLPVTMLASNAAGPVQIHIPKGEPVGSKTIGMWPAYFAFDKADTIAGTDTNVTISMPAYNGLAAVADATKIPQYTVFGQDRPVVVTVGTAAQADNCIIGLWGFPIDDAAAEIN